MVFGASAEPTMRSPGDAATGSIPETVVSGESSDCQLMEDLGGRLSIGSKLEECPTHPKRP